MKVKRHNKILEIIENFEPIKYQRNMLGVYSCTAVGARKTELILGVNAETDVGYGYI